MEDEILTRRILEMVEQQDRMFAMLDDEIITSFVINDYIAIKHEDDMSGTFLTEFGKDKLKELKKITIKS